MRISNANNCASFVLFTLESSPLPLYSSQGCQWRCVASTQPAVSVWDQGIPTVAGVSCTTRKCAQLHNTHTHASHDPDKVLQLATDFVNRGQTFGATVKKQTSGSFKEPRTSPSDTLDERCSSVGGLLASADRHLASCPALGPLAALQHSGSRLADQDQLSDCFPGDRPSASDLPWIHYLT